eukprot:GAFH01002354.1.p1 GENE.GAFH01002354.1~~GAFH01002354.1.p1  ORF type:complete len:379 (-),score=138.36 GAFH01002354.1:60-1040(-)
MIVHWLGAHGLICFASAPKVEFRFDIAKRCIPVCTYFVLMLVFNNLCLNFTPVWLYQVSRSLTIIFQIIFTYLLQHKATSPRALMCCAVVFVGFLFGTFTTAQKGVGFTLVGAVFGVLSTIFLALYSTYISKTTAEIMQGNTWRTQLYTNAFASVFLVPFIGLEARQLVHAPILANPVFWVVMVISALFGFLINLSQQLQIKYTSPLSHNISGTAKACVQTVLSFMLFPGTTRITNTDLVGIVLTIFGSSSYSLVRLMEMRATEQARQQAQKDRPLPAGPQVALSPPADPKAAAPALDPAPAAPAHTLALPSATVAPRGGLVGSPV